MGFCPNCGSYVSPGANVCSCGTTLTYASDIKNEQKPTEFERREQEKSKVRRGYWKKAEKLMEEEKYLEAVEYIDMALETSGSDFYIRAKAKAYYFAGMYEEALPLFKASVKPYLGVDNYVIYEWIADTLTALNRFDESLEAYDKAIDIINEEYERAVNFFKSERWMGYERIESACASELEKKNERISNVRDRIAYSNRLRYQSINKKSYEPQKSDYELKEELLMAIGKRNLITVAGTRYHGNPKFEKGMSLELVKEEDNEFDDDAVAVYADGVKVGYAANSDGTCCHLTSKASDIEISDVLHAEYLMYFGYAYHIAEITR